MGWRQDLIRIGITAGTAALMAKGGKDRARKALEAVFPDIQNVEVKSGAEKEPQKAGKK